MTGAGSLNDGATVRIRRARPDDAAALERLHTRTWREAYWGALPDRVAATGLYDAAAWRATIARTRRPEGRDSAVLVAETAVRATESGDALLAFAVAGVASTASGRAGASSRLWDAEVFMLYVLGGAQRQGVGRRLLSGCAHHAVSRGFFTLGLWCVTDNHPARAFYEALGGQPAGKRLHTMRGVETPVAGYRWDDARLAALLESGSVDGVE